MQTAGKAVAIITARGGSKRIPHKNIKEFCGKPILAYSIEAALASGLFDRVMVSTDDEEIAEVARKYGAEVPFLRSEKTANDYATTKDVLEEVLAEYEKRGEHFDTLCCIYPTAPFVTPDRLSEAMDQLEEREGDTLLPVVRFLSAPESMVVEQMGRYLVSSNGRSIVTADPRIWNLIIMMRDSFMYLPESSLPDISRI